MVTTPRLATGDVVVSAGGRRLGVVRQIEVDRLKLDRRLVPDYWLATEYIDHTSDGLVQMVLTKEGIGAARISAPRS